MRSELNVLWSLVAEKCKLSDPEVFYNVCIARKIIGVLKRVHSWQNLGEYQTHLDQKQNFVRYFFFRKKNYWCPNFKKRYNIFQLENK